MKNAGSALMGIGTGTGDSRAIDAAKAAISSPLLEATIEGAKGVLFNITGGLDMSLLEVNEVAEIISKAVDPDARIIFGAVIDERLEGEVRITVIATGFTGVAGTRDSHRFLDEEESDFKPLISAEEIDAIPAFIRRKSG